jgi:hypothetical protein
MKSIVRKMMSARRELHLRMDYRRLVENLYQGLLHRAPEPGAVDHWTKELMSGVDINVVFDLFMKSEEFRRTTDSNSRLFVPPGHFYSPIVNVAEVRPVFNQKPDTPKQLPAITVDGQAMLALWERLLPHLNDTPFPDEPAPGFRYYFKNTAFAYGDGSILSAMLRLFRPKRLVEVGSGYSSACAMDTIDRFLGGNVAVSFVEPYPELLIKLLGDDAQKRVKIHPVGVQNAELGIFTALEAGDFLFIDSTHVMKTGSDVCHELFSILPALKAGVFVHFHDIFWPFEYRADWVLEENRSWNELYGLRAFLMYNDAFEIVFFNDYFVKQHRDRVMADYPAMMKNSGGSIWLRKK